MIWSVLGGVVVGVLAGFLTGRRLAKGGLVNRRELGLQSIPVDRIVGSVDKPCSFMESFSPRSDTQRGRWTRAYAAAHGLTGYEPIHVYRLSEDFFVLDGHFRVSVTKTLGCDTFDAFVEAWD